MIAKLHPAMCAALFCVVAIASNRSFAVEKLPVAKPEAVWMHSSRLDRIDELATEGIAANRMPGCVVMVGRKGKIVFHRAYGHREIQPNKLEMKKDTVFDMASITKPVATATSVMILVDQGKIRIRDRVTTYIPEFGNSGKESVTIKQLLTHQAGFVPDNSIADYEQGREQAFKNIYDLKTMYAPGKRFVYSDVGFILLDDLIQRQSGLSVDVFSRQNIFEPLGMNETGYLPNVGLRNRSATTEQRESRWMRGEVHDPRAYLMDKVAGHAGLFSTAEDLAVYAQMMLNGGHYGGKRILSRATVELMTDAYRIVEGEKVSIRGLGWDKLTGYSSNRAENMSDRAYGHGGFTGTVLWIDPAHELFFIFLSNRVHPNGKGSVNRLAGRMATVAIGAIEEEGLAENFTIEETSLKAADTKRQRTSPVLSGIDVLSRDHFELLKGQRIGLITNQTGINCEGRTTIDLLRESSDVDLAALFSPEHGIAGKLDQGIVGDSVDGSGMKVFSLYGATREPTAEQLSKVDTLVFDIQDIGCRFYTYISTMGLAMKAAAKHKKRFVVLDRPNPINGHDFGGPMLDEGSESFVAFHSLPVRHGMTVGELARMFQAELGLKELDLHVINCEGWSRGSYFDETSQPWVNPSPNMRNLNEALLYPGIGLWETTNISVGRGTDTPFEVVGAPWISSIELASELNAASLQGVRFTPRDFTPNASKFANEKCGGVQISITDRESFDPIHCGIEFACALHRLYATHWRLENANRLLCNQCTLDSIKAGKSADEILNKTQTDLAAFAKRRAQFLHYKTE